ncbi:MAG: protein kinase domain-containing protein [Aureliella sp.]
MHDDPTSHHDRSESDQVIDSIVDDFVEQALGDGVPDIDAACARYPAFADRIRQAAASLKLLADQHSHLDGKVDSSNLRDQFSNALGRTSQNVVDPTLASSSIKVAEKDPNFGDKYRLREELGEGGFGVVYVAEQLKPVRRKVAIKVVKPGMDSKEVLARFDAERQALAMMDHPNVAKVLDGGMSEDGRPYFVMELIRGIPITAFCNSQKLSILERLEIFRDTCLAVQHAHMKGIIHRDIKPSNVLVTMRDETPVAKVIDFGVAKALHSQLTDATVYTAFGQMIGTPIYMSPEQIQLSEQDVDTRSDIYSLGVLLYELITGDTPFTRQALMEKGIQQFREMVCDTEPPRPSHHLSTVRASDDATLVDQRRYESREMKRISGELDWIVLKSLEKNRSRRYQSCAEFAKDIDRYLTGEPVEACPPTLGYKLSKFARQNRVILTTATLVFVLLSLGIATTGWQAYRATKAEASALSESNRKSEALSDLDEALAKSKAETKEKERALEAESRLRKKSDSLGEFLTSVFKAPGKEQQGRSMKAVDLLNKSRDELLANEELEDLTKASLFGALSESYSNLNLYQEGLRCAEISMEHLKKGNASALELAEGNLLLGNSLDMADRNLQQAIDLVRDAIGTFEDSLGATDERTLRAKVDLSSMLAVQERYPEAKELADEAAGLAAPNSDLFIFAKFAQLQLAGNQRKSSRCIELCNELLEHPRLNTRMRINTMQEKVQALSEAGQLVEAVTQAMELKNLAFKEFGESHLYSNTLSILGYVQMRNKDYAAATESNRKAWQMRSQLLGPTDIQTLQSQLFYGVALKRIGNKEEAGKIYKQNLEGWWQRLDEIDDGFEDVVRVAGLVSESLAYEEARRLLQETSEKIRSAKGDNSKSRENANCRIQLMLANMSWSNGDYEEAEGYFQSSFDDASASGNVMHQLACCRECLVACLEHDSRIALRWARQLGEVHRKLGAKDGAWKQIDKSFVHGVFRLAGENTDAIQDYFAETKSTPSGIPVLLPVGNPYPIANGLRDAGLLAEALGVYSKCPLFENKNVSLLIPAQISQAQLLLINNQPKDALAIVEELEEKLSAEYVGFAEQFGGQVTLLKALALSEVGRFNEALAELEPGANKMLLVRKALILSEQGNAGELQHFIENELAPTVSENEILLSSSLALFRAQACLLEGMPVDRVALYEAIGQASGREGLAFWWRAFGESLLGRQAMVDGELDTATSHLSKAGELWCSKGVRLIRPNFFPTSVPRESMLLLIKTLRSEGQTERAARWELILKAFQSSPLDDLFDTKTQE